MSVAFITYHEVWSLRTLLAALKALLFLFVLPKTLLGLAARLAPALPVLAGPGSPLSVACAAAGTAVAALGAHVAVRAWLVLLVIGKRWPFGDTVFLVDRYTYRFARHPLYWGYTVFWLGIALRAGSLVLLLEAAVLGAGLACYALFVEERSLTRRFGERHTRYRNQVPVLWPCWKALWHDLADLGWVALVGMALFRWLFGLLWNVDAEGLEHVPQDGKCLVLCNHVNLADPFLVALYFTRPIHFMASDELFRPALTRVLFRLLQAFPKRRWNSDTKALRSVHRKLSEGRIVGIFPEGYRTWDGAAAPVDDAVYRFLLRCDAPIVCVSLIGGHEAFPRWSKLPRLCNVTVRIHAPLPASEFAGPVELGRAVEERIFACATEPTRVPRALASHAGITKVAWGCIKCGQVRSLAETRAGLVCRSCGAAWDVSPGLDLTDRESGEVLAEPGYHDRLRSRVGCREMAGGPAVSATAVAYGIDPGGRLSRLGEGTLLLDESVLHFQGPRASLTVEPKRIRFAYLNLANHLVVTDDSGTFQFRIIGDSPVRWEDHLAVARGVRLVHWQPRLA